MDDVRWLSYGELAEARGISKASAQRLVMRRHWLRRRGNDQTVRVAVPVGEDQPKHDDTDDVRSDVRGDITHTISVLESAVATLRDQLTVANSRADRSEQERDRLQSELAGAQEALAGAETRLREAEAARARAEGMTEAERQRADRAEAELAGAQEALAGAEMRLREAEAARAEFWSRSRFARLKGVWRGRGG
jgi:chromosome segregation ATPase